MNTLLLQLCCQEDDLALVQFPWSDAHGAGTVLSGVEQERLRLPCENPNTAQAAFAYSAIISPYRKWTSIN